MNNIIENEVIKKLPLLTTYPIDINADGIYKEEEEPLYKWEVDTIKKLLNKLCNKYKEKHITPDIYTDFFNSLIKKFNLIQNIL